MAAMLWKRGQCGSKNRARKRGRVGARVGGETGSGMMKDWR